jgi:predicted ATPase/class 3 adenylate cyclase
MSSWSGPPLPTGTLTFLFTDVEGSTRLWEQHPQLMRAAMARHDALMTTVFEQHDGVVVRPRGEGDSLFVVFVRASDAVAAALAGQRALAAEDWGAVGPLRVRMGLHTGEADVRDGDYYGSAVNRCARIRGAGHGGQVLVSQTTADLVRTQLSAGVAMPDLGRHRLRGLSEPEQLFQLVTADPPLAFPPLITLDARPHNLPTQLTSFIGREQEVAELVALLGTVRLLTLTGPGGSGKTRLALAVAEQVLDAFPDGVWFVDLSGVSDAAGVVPAIAQVLGVVDSAGHTLAVALAAYLRHRHLLLLLDNFEQVLEVALVVYDLLREAPQLTVVVTSRTLLRVEGEQEYAVAPLPLPELGVDRSVAALAQNAAVQLFVTRAQTLAAGFTLTAENAPTVAELCRRLEGLPLAIELAAARVKLLPPAALLARLDQRLPLLTGGARSLPARQQTLRATIQWSWDLLSVGERVLFRRLGVFAGGWTLEGAEAVCNSDGDLEVLEGLASLLDQSLVHQTERNGEPRFSMLATLREFALEQLAACNEGEVLRRRHAGFYTARAEQAHERYWYRGRAQEDVLQPLDPERDNLMAALAWAGEQHDALLGLRLATGLGMWFFVRSPGEGRRWLERMLGLPDAVAAGGIRGIAVWWLANCAVPEGESQRALAAFEAADSLFRAAEDLPWLSRTLGAWGAVLAAPAPARAQHLVTAGRGLARATSDRLLTAHAEWWAAWPPFYSGELEQARAHFAAALQLAREVGADYMRLLALGGLAWTARRLGEPVEVRRLQQEIRPLAATFGDRSWTTLACIDLGLLASADGDLATAGREWRAGLEAARELGSLPFTATCLAGLAGVLSVCGQPACAARVLGATARVWQDAEQYAYWRSYFEEVQTPALSTTRTALSDKAFAQAWAEGQALSLEQATDLALAALADLADAAAVDPTMSA